MEGVLTLDVCASIRDLCVSFGERVVLHRVALDFPAKKITVLLGRSGSGKTTLLRSLNRLNECFDGYRGSGDISVRLGGAMAPVSGPGALPVSRLRSLVGMVFQTPNPLPLSIRKNMLLPMAMVLGTKKEEAEEAMRLALHEVGLWDEIEGRLDRPAFSLSGGQQQRLCLARALVLKPEILLLDEPTASLDRLAAARIEELILSLKDRYSIVMVSHSLLQAGKLADFLAVMSEGRVEETMNASDLPKGPEAEALLEKLL